MKAPPTLIYGGNHVICKRKEDRLRKISGGRHNTPHGDGGESRKREKRTEAKGLGPEAGGA